MTSPSRPVVFCSHASADKPAVLAFAQRLAADGIDAWVDQWEIDSGQDLVARINDGLARCTAGLIFFSRNTPQSRWVDTEVGALTYRAVQGLRVIPVLLDADAAVPPLLAHYLRRSAAEYDAIRDTLLDRRSRPGLGPLPERQWNEVLVRLTGAGADQVRTQVWLGAEGLADTARPLSAMLKPSPVLGRTEQSLIEVGRAAGTLMFPPPAADRMSQWLSERRPGDRLEVVVEAGPEALAIPVETARLPVPGNPLLVGLPGVTLRRRPLAPPARLTPALPGPLKILIAVAAPDEEKTSGSVLDGERELAKILSALPEHGSQARVLEVASLDEITTALRRDAFHVLHLSGHGGRDGIELEDEDGSPVLARPEDIAAAIDRGERPLPLVFLSCCDPGSGADTSTGLADRLLAAGLSQVVAMRGNVTDHYATELAAAFYRNLADAQDTEAADALARARRDVELERQRALQAGGPASPPEYATATILSWGTPQPVLAPGTPVPLKARPALPISGPVPQLGVEDLVGRRVEVREALRVLLDDERSIKSLGRRSGVALLGVGGVGKSTVAGRIMSRMVDRGWVCATVAGPIDLPSLCSAAAAALDELPDPAAGRLAAQLTESADDILRVTRVGRALRDHKVLLVLDNFEDNLSVGGESFTEPATGALVASVLRAAGAGRLLITSRYPAAPLAGLLHEVRILPLSRQQARKLLLRLPAFEDISQADTSAILRLAGGHPRLLELVDAAMRGNTTRLTSMADRLDRLAASARVDLQAARDDARAGLDDAVNIMLRDIALEDLIADLTHAQRDVLIQVAVSTIPISDAAVSSIVDREEIGEILELLVRLTLLSRVRDSHSFVERWTAQGLKRVVNDEAWRDHCRRAGQYRVMSGAEGVDVYDAMEAARNFAEAGDYEQASDIAASLAAFLEQQGQLLTLATFAGELLSSLPMDLPASRYLGSREANANQALGLTVAAEARYQQIAENLRQLIVAEPDRADYQRDLSVSYNKLGDLMVAVGRGEEALRLYQQSLEIRSRLANAEPDRAGYQRDLSVSYNKLGDLMVAVGRGEEALRLYQQSLDITVRLGGTEPDRADYQRDLSVSYNKLGDLMAAVGRGEEALRLYQQSLDITVRLAGAEPDRADYQRDLSVSYERLGDLMVGLGRGEEALLLHQQSLEIRTRLAGAEPDRADYQRDLSVSYNKLGDLMVAVGRGEEALRLYQQSLEIRSRLAGAEPDRADYQRDLSVSYNKLGDLMVAVGRVEEALLLYQQSLDLAVRLAGAEPDRADYQRDLSIAYERIGEVFANSRRFEEAIQHYELSLPIAIKLAEGQPNNLRLRDDLRITYVRLEALSRSAGEQSAADRYQQLAQNLAEQPPANVHEARSQLGNDA